MARIRIPWARSKVFWALIGAAAVLITARAVLPIFVERFVNRKLDELDGYSGRIADVDLALIRGAYVIEGVRIVKTGGRIPVPFFTASEVDISVEWSALFDGDIVAEIQLDSPRLNFVKGPTEKTSQTEPGDNWTETVRDLAPFRINRFAIADGEVHFRDFHSKPKVDVFLQRIHATARNLTNAEDLSGTLVATFDAHALAMGSGELALAGKYNPYAERPTFEVDASLDRLNLAQLNTFLKAYGNVDAERGKLSVDAEFAARRGRFRGYVKPFIDDLQLLRWKEEEESFFGKLWEGLVGLVGEILEDQDKSRIATRIPFSGSVDDPDPDIWSTIGGLLKNAFIEALRRGLEDKIGLKASGEPEASKEG
jgi:hypothetical protein